MTGERFQVVQGGKANRTKRQHKLWAGCNVCEAHHGVRTREVVQVRSMVEETTKGRLVNGRTQLFCFFCMVNGRRTPLTT